MPKPQMYSSNAEKQRAYRKRKAQKLKNSNKSNKKIVKKVKVQKPEIVEDGPGFVAYYTEPEISEKEINNIYKKLKIEPGKETEKTLDNFILSLKTLNSLESQKLWCKLYKGSKNNKQYIERIINDTIRVLIEINWIRD